MGLFRVSRRQDDLGTGVTNQTITAVDSLTTTLERLTNNRFQSGGDTTQSDNESAAEISGYMYLDSTTNIRYQRNATSPTGSGDTRFTPELWEYLGNTSGDDAWTVRSRDQVVILAGTASALVSLDTTATDVDRCIPFITSIASTDASSNSATNATAVAYLNSTSQYTVERGGNSGIIVVSVVVIEFTGSNWTVGHCESGETAADSGSLTIKTGASGGGSDLDIGDWDTAAIFTQMRGDRLSDTNQAIADTSCIAEPGADTETIDWEFHTDHDGSTNRIVCHVLQHDDMEVTRYSDTDNSAGANDIDITSAGLTDLEQSLVEVTRNSSGTGFAYGRGWVNARLTSLTNCELWCHRSGNTIQTRIQVIDVSSIGLITGSGSGDFPLPEGSATGDQEFIATGAGSFPLAQGSGTGAQVFTATAAGTFPVAEGTGTGNQIFTAVGAGVFPVVEGTGTGNQVFTATAAGVFPSVVGTGTGSQVFIGAGVGFFPGLTGAGLGTVTSATFIATGAGFFPVPTGTGTANLIFTATAAGVFPVVEGTGTGAQEFVATGAGTFPVVEATGTGNQVFSAVGVGLFPVVEGSATGNQIFTATGIGFFPGLTGAGIANLPGIDIDCITDISGSVVPITGVSGSVVPLTAIQGSFINQTAISGSHILVTEIDGSYDDVSEIDGSICN